MQVPGEIEAEFAPIGAKSVLKKILTYRDTAPLYFPKGKGLDALPDAPAALSSWLSEEELDYYANKYEQTGFTGAVNYYRAFPMQVFSTFVISKIRFSVAQTLQNCCTLVADPPKHTR